MSISDDQFEKFHGDNPHVYRIMVDLARQWKERTRRGKLGIRMLWERARWEIAMSTTDYSDYKLNDHYTPYYARLIMYYEGDLDGMFDIRSSHTDSWLQNYILKRGRTP